MTLHGKYHMMMLMYLEAILTVSLCRPGTLDPWQSYQPRCVSHLLSPPPMKIDLTGIDRVAEKMINTNIHNKSPAPTRPI